MSIKRLLVLVKQVPDTTEIKIDPVTKTLIRAGVPSILNPFDSYALELALRIKDSCEAHVTVVSMGPEQAKEVIKECLSVGADEGYLVSDRAFGGSDTLATSYILSTVIRSLEQQDGQFDCILCGKQAIDGDTAQVGPETAEHLSRPQVTCIVGLKTEDAGGFTATKEVENGYQEISVPSPCLVTVTKYNFELRYPNIRRKLAASRAVIPIIRAEDLEIDLSRCGLKGSPTKVFRSFTPELTKNGIRLENMTAEEMAKALTLQLAEVGLV